MNREQKSAVVDQVATDIQEAEAVFAVDYRGMSVTQAAELRGALIDADAQLQVVKNTLTERAAGRAGADSLKALLDGPTALTFVRGDVAAAAKAIADFRRTNELPQFKGGTMNGDPLTVDQIESIAKLPSRDTLNAQLVGVVASPITGLARGLNALIAGIAVQLGQIAEQGLIGQGASAAAGSATETGAATDAGAADAEAAAEPDPAGDAEAPTEAGDETPAAAPGDPVSEAEAAEAETSENETPSEGDTEQEG